MSLGLKSNGAGMLQRLAVGVVILGLAALPARAQETIAWQPLNEALTEAATTAKPILLYVHAPWCGPCKRMERDTFPAVTPLLDRFIRAEVDFNDHDSRLTLGDVTRTEFEWAQHFGSDVTPGFIFLQPDGTPITRATGYYDAHTFSVLLAYTATGAYRHASFEDYAQHILAASPE